MKRFLLFMLVATIISLVITFCLAILILPTQAQTANDAPIACWITDGFLAVIDDHEIAYFVGVMDGYVLPLHPAVPVLRWPEEVVVAKCDPSHPLYPEPDPETDTRLSPNGEYLAYFDLHEGLDSKFYYLVVWTQIDSDHPLQISVPYGPL